MSDIELVQLSPRPFVGVRRDVHHTKLQPYFTEVLPKVMGKVVAAGTCGSPPMAMWHGMDRETGICDTQAGCFVTEAMADEDDITHGTTAGGDVLKLVHTGPYDTMHQSWMQLFGRASELGRAPGKGWEIYVDDPSQVEASALRTELYLPLQ